jgi:hypothetical protein
MCIVMKRYENNLADHIGSTGLMMGTSTAAPSPTAHFHRVQVLLRDVAQGMCVLHNFPTAILHRDLKLTNIFVDSGRAYVGDLGVAKVQSRSRTANFGTFAYRAPETFDGRFEKASDVYAFAMVVYGMIAKLPGTSPWVGMTEEQIVKALVIQQQRPSLEEIHPDCPQAVVDLMRQCWHQNPISRPTFEDIRDVLNHMCASCVLGFFCSPGDEDRLHLLPEVRVLQQNIPSEHLKLHPMACIGELYDALEANLARVVHVAMHTVPSELNQPTPAFTKAERFALGEETDLCEPGELAAMIGKYARGKDGGTVECVVLNICKGHQIAAQLVEHGVPFVVAWETMCDSEAAVVFATGFYTALQAQPVDFHAAFTQAVALLRLENYLLADPVKHGHVRDDESGPFPAGILRLFHSDPDDSFFTIHTST